MFATVFGSLIILLGLADLDGQLNIVVTGFAGLVLIIVGGIIISGE